MNILNMQLRTADKGWSSKLNFENGNDSSIKRGDFLTSEQLIASQKELCCVKSSEFKLL